MKQAIIFLLIFSTYLSAQSVYKEGNLVRIDFREREISLADTFLTWYRRSDEFRSNSLKYVSSVSCGSKNYLISYYYYSDNFITFQNGSGYSLYREDGTASYDIGGVSGSTDLFWPYLCDFPTQLKTRTGVWFLMGMSGNRFVSEDGSVYGFFQHFTWDDAPIFICGEVDSLYMVSYMDEDYYEIEYRLLELDNMPEFDSTNAPKITIYPDNPVHHVAHIDSNFYLIDVAGEMENLSEGHLGIYTKENLQFNLVRIIKDNIEPRFDYRWRYKDDHLYMRGGIYIKQYDFNYADTNFVFQQNVFEAPQGTALSYDWKFAARIDGDSLYVMKTFENDTVNILDISRITAPSRLIIDSPYVYIHQLKKVTDVKENDEAIVSKYSLSSYPNPFNAVTTITYSVPEAEQVEIKIYDVLGREVTTLKNEIEEAGKHQVTWDANNTSSGIYICTMKTERKLMSTKLLLMK
ncbi:MAG: T9SS type A sorting domain-containing protein [Melioribacteraceae bacterium]|nr:T9SS type A sorting domain-containing protein [Melioribacteraceae bacterium]MCF8354096.1 T9SS type A sorting domain-containing protein [Melioribacteraceae bacterium]MCF8393768.1 T9SS type A sorting domain-containing protein [Melioribacteraceae bacterium]MCF8419512.1 T9SS type A sorting domain-containing protein [Melioribacteraceae bacterium]